MYPEKYNSRGGNTVLREWGILSENTSCINIINEIEKIDRMWRTRKGKIMYTKMRGKSHCPQKRTW